MIRWKDSKLIFEMMHMKLVLQLASPFLKNNDSFLINRATDRFVLHFIFSSWFGTSFIRCFGNVQNVDKLSCLYLQHNEVSLSPSNFHQVACRLRLGINIKNELSVFLYLTMNSLIEKHIFNWLIIRLITSILNGYSQLLNNNYFLH